jgi:hypothetical protein
MADATRQFISSIRPIAAARLYDTRRQIIEFTPAGKIALVLNDFSILY